MKILQYVTDFWTMKITFYKEKPNPLSSLMTGATYCTKTDEKEVYPLTRGSIL